MLRSDQGKESKPLTSISKVGKLVLDSPLSASSFGTVWDKDACASRKKINTAAEQFLSQFMDEEMKTEAESDLPKVSQLPSLGPGIWTQTV